MPDSRLVIAIAVVAWLAAYLAEDVDALAAPINAASVQSVVC
jgi:hypothetical protein